MKTNVLDDLNTNILDFKLLGYSRSVIDIRLSRSNNNPLREINIDFKILEKNDGFTGQILLEGNKEAKIKLKGDIEGVDLNAPKLFRWYDYVNLPTLISSIIIIMISTLFLHSVLRKGSKYNKKEKIIYTIIFPLFVIFTIYFFIYLGKSEIESGVLDIVPTEILTHQKTIKLNIYRVQ